MPEVSLLIPARSSGHSLEGTVREAVNFLESRYPGGFEIILIPNPSPKNPDDGSIEIAGRLAKMHSAVRSVPHSLPEGKGAALRTGFQFARGDRIFFTDADLPYDLKFFDDAAGKLDQGYDLVTANRRLPNSVFDVPVSLLKIAYRRHRLGLLFNSIVRRLLRLPTTDTQAGLKAMSRRLAEKAFSAMRCPGFFFDLEIFLVARHLGYAHAELPVTLRLNTEKSTVRVLRESLQAALWLARIALGNLSGAYGREPSRRGVPSRYPKTPFLMARWWLTPYSRIARELPPRGRILDLGCGHGLFATAAALSCPEREILGIDHDDPRIQAASEATKDLRNLKFQAAGLLPLPEGTFAAITLIDVMHYFEPELQAKIIADAYAHVEPGGRFIIRDVDPEGGIVARWNRFYEKLATSSGFTRSQQRSRLHFHSIHEWVELLRAPGFRVRNFRCSSPLFSDILYVCEKPLNAKKKEPA